ncbi:MAG TPA: SseB family protein [Gammaproteobacteria bacterium]|nr:SseB family protein [Gammaproteobacteria bacterium]
MTETKFTNELEYLLDGARRGIVSLATFYQCLTRSWVYILCNKEWDGKSADPELKTMMIPERAGSDQLYIALFTDQAHTDTWRKAFPEYAYPLKVLAGAMLRFTNERVGIAVNPGHEVGVQIKPPGVTEMRQLFGDGLPVRRDVSGGKGNA